MDDVDIRLRCIEIAKDLADRHVIDNRKQLTDMAQEFFDFVKNGDKLKNKPGPKPKQ